MAYRFIPFFVLPALIGCAPAPAPVGFPGIDDGEALAVLLPSEKAVYFPEGERNAAAEALGVENPDGEVWTVDVPEMTAGSLAINSVSMQVLAQAAPAEVFNDKLDKALKDAFASATGPTFSAPLIVAKGYQCNVTVTPRPRETCVRGVPPFSLKTTRVTYQTCSTPGAVCKYAIAPTALQTQHRSNDCSGPGAMPRWRQKMPVCFP